MSDPDQRNELATFSAPPYDAISDLCGDLANAGFRALFAGNQYMVLPDIMTGFLEIYPGTKSVFYETLPPGIVISQLRAGGLQMGSLELRFTPDLIAASPQALKELHREGLVDPPKAYASNVLCLLVRSGNPSKVNGLADLARPGLRVALPNPDTEGIGQLALQALAAAGGDRLRDEVFGTKRHSGETVLTTIHHRQSPAWLLDDATDVAFMWETEARHHLAIGTPVEAVPIDEVVNQRGEYAAAIVKAGPNREVALQFLKYITGTVGQAIYASYGFTPSNV